VPYTEHLYRWEKKGAKGSAEALGVELAHVIKTLLFEDDAKRPLVVLMDGTHEVSAKELARTITARSVVPCEPKRAESLTGYQVGGISPFGTKTKMPVYMQRTLLDLPLAYINGGKRGFLVALPPSQIRELLDATPVDVAI
jgi:Cys-tRNA(Pro) deacylase